MRRAEHAAERLARRQERGWPAWHAATDARRRNHHPLVEEDAQDDVPCRIKDTQRNDAVERRSTVVRLRMTIRLSAAVWPSIPLAHGPAMPEVAWNGLRESRSGARRCGREAPTAACADHATILTRC
eukprot:scaffold1146_cov399-Prasinococcus_capsulatus_cf.AAC.44